MVENTERPGRFYSPWPVQGVKLSKQWDNLRVNHEETKAVVRGSLLDVNTENDYFQQERALRGHEYGQNDASKKFRWVYSATDGKFRMQRNDGTQATPSWTDLLVADTSGTLVEIDPSLSGDLDLNGNNILQVKNINTDLINSENWQPRFEVTDSNLDNIFYTVRRITFNRESGFYVTGDSNGEPVVSSNVRFGKAEKFTFTSAVEWQADHGFGVVPQYVQVYDDAQRLVIPNTADVSNPDTAYFYFTNAMAGHAVIATGGLGPQELRPILTITDGTSTYKDKDKINFSGDDFYLSSDAKGNPVVNLTAFSNVDHGNLIGLTDDDHTQYIKFTDTDDTPVNSAITIPISSNWAFDHENDADQHTEYILADGSRSFTGVLQGDLKVAETVTADAGFYGPMYHVTGRAVGDNTVLDGNTKDVSWDWADSNTFFMNLKRPTTLHTPSSLESAQTVNLVTKNDGFYNISWSSKYIFKDGGQLSPTLADGAIDLWSMVYHPSIDKIIVARLDNCFY